MRYVEYRDLIQSKLRDQPSGLTWKQLRDELDLPYDRPCPEWTKRLENEIGLTRTKGEGRALIWKSRLLRVSPNQLLQLTGCAREQNVVAGL